MKIRPIIHVITDNGEEDHLKVCEDEECEKLNHFKESPLLTEITREFIAKKYRFEKVLGEGAQGKVKVASLRADPSKKFAIKSIPR